VSLRRKSIPLRHCWIANGTSTGLGAGIDKDRLDYTIYSWRMGSWPDHETRGGPDHLRWFWSFTVTCPMTHSDRASTLEEAKVQLQKSWDAWKAWAGPVTMKSPGTARMVSVVMSNVGLAGWTVGRGPSRPRC
jgi:hypothetical protein